jgi:hypothetical protein
MSDFDVERVLDQLDDWLFEGTTMSPDNGLSIRRHLKEAFTRCHDAAVREREALWIEYIDLMGEELNDLIALASTHGWQSSRVGEGKRMRGLLGIEPHERRRQREDPTDDRTP